MPFYFLSLSEKKCRINISRYAVKWDAPCRSQFQFDVKQWIKPYWQSHIVTEEMPLVGTRMKLDLVNITRKIIIETCGKQHEKYVPFFHKNNEQELLKQMKRDLSKSKWAEINGFSYIEIYERDLPLKKEFFEEMGVNL